MAPFKYFYLLIFSDKLSVIEQKEIQMYRSLTQKLSTIFSKFSNKSIQEKDIQLALIEIEKALIDADVSLKAIDQFKAHVLNNTKDINTIKNLDVQSHLMKIIKDALLTLLQHQDPLPNFQHSSLQVILMVGLQGAGKTTSCGKLAHYIKSQHKKNIMMASVDVYRPAAIEQLKKVSQTANVDFHPHHDLAPIEICKNAIDHAKRTNQDILIIDTAGRLDIDQDRMLELKNIHQTINPQHVFYVVDSMMGQSALDTADAFNKTIPLTGVILSKADSDTKGGVALSVKTVVHQPIFWIGTGEGLDKLEPFNPERITNQLLDQGDIIGLAEKAKQHMDQEKNQQMSKRLQSGQLSLGDMLEQIQQIQKMGGMLSILKMLPGSAKIPDHVLKMIEDDTKMKTIECLIQSMTPQERNNPELVRNQKSRQHRILKGSGRGKPEINDLLKTYDKMKKLTEKLKGGKMKTLMKQFMQSDQFPPME